VIICQRGSAPFFLPCVDSHRAVGFGGFRPLKLGNSRPLRRRHRLSFCLPGPFFLSWHAPVPKDGRTHLHLSPRPPSKKDNKEKENPVCVCECVVTQRHRKSHMLKGKRRESLSPCPFGERTRRRWATRGRTGQGIYRISFCHTKLLLLLD
jgi:hypothetical protein